MRKVTTVRGYGHVDGANCLEVEESRSYYRFTWPVMGRLIGQNAIE
jgi:hypothetical protein